MGHPYVCRADDDLRRLRAARREGEPYIGSLHRSWREFDHVNGCVATGCLRGPHGLGWFRPHAYEPPPAPVLLERMRERRIRRIERRIKARGTWDVRPVFHVWVPDDECDDWDVNRFYGDLPTAVSVTRERLGISKFTVPERDGAGGDWYMYSDLHDVTAWITRRVAGTLVRP
jgi:hypothetical protein